MNHKNKSFIYDNQLIATICINIGLNNKNPILKITSNSNIQLLVMQLIRQYNLPSKIYPIIMERVQQQLMRENLSPNCIERSSYTPIKLKSTSNNNKTISPIAKQSAGLNKRDVSPKLVLKQKKNSFHNLKLADYKKPLIKPKINKTSQQSQQKIIEKLFLLLTKNNPNNIKILSPLYMNLDGLTPEILGILQQFFQKLPDKDFQQLTMKKFISTLQQKGYSSKIQKLLKRLI